MGATVRRHKGKLSSLWRQGFDDTAIGHGAALALTADAAQFVCQADKIGNFLFDSHQMRRRDSINSAAIPLAVLGQGQQLAHLSDAESQIPASANEAETTQMVSFVGAVVAVRAAGAGSKPACS